MRNRSDARYAVPAIGGVDPRRAEELLQHVRGMHQALTVFRVRALLTDRASRRPAPSAKFAAGRATQGNGLGATGEEHILQAAYR